MQNIIEKQVAWLYGEVKSPPFSKEARIKAGYLLRKLQFGEKLFMPHSKSMKTVGQRCHELRIQDKNEIWRIIYRLDHDAIIIGEVFKNKNR